MNEVTKKYLNSLTESNRRRIMQRGATAIRYFYRPLRNNINTWRYQVKSFFILCAHRHIKSDHDKKISIIIPTLSKGPQADHILKLKKLLSVYLTNQTHQNYEAIVWCDGPNAIVESMAASLKDARIKICNSDGTIGKWGHPQTRLGVSSATGDYFVRMNDDNKPYRYYLQFLLNAFDDDTGFVYGRVIFKGDARKIHSLSLKNSFIIPGDKNGQLRCKNIDCMCYMVRMDLAKKYIKHWNDEYAADWRFVEALLRNGVKSKFVNSVIGNKL